MSEYVLFLFALVSALGCGLVAGIFFAFSTFIMKALARLPARQGIAAMQSINVVVLNPWFLGVFLGTTAACAVLAVASLLTWSRSGAGWLLAGSVLYFTGTFVVTAACNVPRNQALAKFDADSAAAATVWAGYVRSWTAWNHVRTAAALLASAALILALCVSPSVWP